MPTAFAMRRAWRRRSILASFAAAAALAAGWTLNAGPAWEVAATDGSGNVLAGGRPIPIGHTADLERAVRSGLTIEVPPGAGLELTSRERLVVHLTQGTVATLSRPPGRWIARAAHARVTRGEVLVTTGSRFLGSRLSLHTPEVRVEVSGTTLSVRCDAGGTRVAVLEGTVAMGPAEGVLHSVERGRIRFVFRDGRAAGGDPMGPAEAAGLRSFRDRARALRME